MRKNEIFLFNKGWFIPLNENYPYAKLSIFMVTKWIDLPKARTQAELH